MAAREAAVRRADPDVPTPRCRTTAIVITQNISKQSKWDDDNKQNPFSGTICCKISGAHKQEIKQIDVKKQLSKEANDVLSFLNRLIKSPLFLDLNKSLAKIFIDLQSDPFIVSAANEDLIENTADNFEKLFSELDAKIYIRTNTEVYCVPSPYECDIEEANKKIKK